MTAAALLAVAAVVLAPPGPAGALCAGWAPSHVLALCHRPAGSAARAWRRLPVGGALSPGVLAAVAGCLAAAVAGPVAAVLAGVSVAVGVVGWRAVRTARAGAVRRGAELELLAALAAELRSGRHPAAALAAVRAPADADLELALAAARATAALGGDVSSSLRGRGTSPPLAKLAAAWQLSEECGAPLADLIAQVAIDLRAAGDLHRAIHVELTGARATGVVLAVLPLLGVALGVAMGAHPIQVLLHTSAGAVCVAGGLAFEVAGLLWVRRLTHGARTYGA